MLPCPVCGEEFEDSDSYFEHLVKERRIMLNSVLGIEFEKLNLLQPEKHPTLDEFIKTWCMKRE